MKIIVLFNKLMYMILFSNLINILETLVEELVTQKNNNLSYSP